LDLLSFPTRRSSDLTRSGAVFTPALEQQLHEELEVARADVWHARDLGVLGFRVWQLLASGPVSVGEMASRLGVCGATVRSKLRRSEEHTSELQSRFD